MMNQQTVSKTVGKPVPSEFVNPGLFWLLVAVVGAAVFFRDGIAALFAAWARPEYSHGPLIPILSAFLFLKQLKDYPIDLDVYRNRWPGLVLICFSIFVGVLGTLANIGDIVAYALILWIGGILLVSWGWGTGKYFWPGVVHLVYMLPLPDTIYYKTTTTLQLFSSELGVWFLGVLSVPVFLEGNIIDLGVLKLHVAEACSGLRYMFPIMSFSYIFAALYRGPMWHKAVLLLAAAPIAVVMNSVRIAVAGVIVQQYGVEWLEGFTHFFEGWVIFLICILLLFALSWLMLRLNPQKMGLAEALDLDTTDVIPQASRIRFVQPSLALVLSGLITVGVATALAFAPDRGGDPAHRDSFVVFPERLGGWEQQGPREVLSPRIASVLGADEYHQVNFSNDEHEYPVGLFMAWYNDQSQGGVHSPEVCLPGGGWEIAWLERADVAEKLRSETPFQINRATIQKGETRMLVYYWFQQRDRKIAWDVAAKFWLMMDGITTGRTDGAIVRLTTVIGPQEDEADAIARLDEMLKEIQEPLPRFIPQS